MADFWDKVNQKNTSGNYSDDYWNKVAGSGYGLEPPEEPSSNPVRRLVADPLVGLAKGAAVGIPETIVGLLDIPTMGHAGKVAETVSRGLGLGDFKSANEMFDNLLTPETREAQLKVSEAKGFLPTIATAIQNPSSIVQTVAESIPSMVAGMRAAGAVSKLIGKPLVEAGVANLPRIAKVGGIAEGAITAGQNIEQVRQQTEEGTLTPSQVAINTLSGVLTGMIGVAGGRLAQRFGLEDVDTLFTGGRSGIVGDKEKGIFKKVLMGAFQEGVLEELPQSMQEQIAQNLALNKPIDDGVFEAGAMGMLAGFAQSTGANIAGSTMRKMKNELDPINQTIKKTVEETLAGELSAIGGWDNGKIDETIKQIPWQDFTLKGEPYQEGVTVGKPYGGEILRPVRPEKPESALDAEFQTIRRIEAPRKEERKILPPGQGFELVGEREKVNTGREIKEIKELQNNIAEREQYISRSEAFKGTEMYNKNVARLEEDKVKLQELTGTIPKTAEVEATSQDKQPWEMTASEFDETFGGTGRTGNDWIGKLGDGKITGEQYDEAVRLGKKNASQVLSDIESTIHINKTSADTHKGIIRNALSEGKPVPPEVLKDYPDLARRSETALKAAPLPPVKTSAPGQENVAGGQNIAANELLKQKEVNRKTIQEMIKNGIITEDSIIRGTDIKYIKAIIKNNDTLPTGKDFEGNDVISASKYIPGNELPMYGGAGGNHVVMIGKSSLLEGKGEGINDWNIKPGSSASDFNYIYKGKKYNYDDIKKILQKKTTDEEIKNPKNLSELKQKQDQILLMREGNKKKTGKVKTAGTKPNKVSIPETLNLVLHQMKNDIETGTAGGKQGVDEAGNTVYAKSGYMPWFSDLVKRYANEKTSPSGKKESISAKYLVNIINKGLKGDKLTPGQQGVWEEVNKIADHESGKTYAGLVNQFEKANAISKPTMADNLEAEGGILNDLNPSSGLFVNYSPEARATMPLGGNITTLDKTMGKPADETIIIYRGASEGRQGIVAGDYVTTNRQLAKDYAGKGIVTEKTVKLSDILDDKTEPLGEEYIYRPGATPGASAAELQKVVETGADYSAAETTKAGKQVTIPGASAAETFNLANPETEISKKLPEQATSKNADMFAEKESVKSEPKNFKEFVLSQGYEYPDSISKAQKPMEEFARVNKAKFKEENKTVADLTREFRGEEKQKTPEKTGDVEGFVADLNPMQKGRVISTLNVKTRYDGVVKTLREHVENLIAAGRKTTTKESIDENARSEAQQERSRILKDGNQNIKAARLKELDEIISNPPRKISYRLTAEDGSFYELNKTGYNYAKYLEGEHERANRETEWSKKLPEQATPKNADMFAIKNKGEKNEQPATMPSLADVQDVFKGQKVTQLENGFLINTKNGASLIVNAVDKITPSKVSLSIGYSKSGLSENEVIAGKYTSGKIELAKTAADKWTLSHESVHFMEDLGVINNNEVHLLKWYIQSLVKEGKFKTQNKNDIGGAEDRAEFLAQSLQKEPKGLSRIINKIQDFIDKLVNAFGIRTVRGIQRDVISGEIYNKETNAQKETRLDIEGGIEKGLNDLYEQEKKNKFSIKEGQPEKAKDDSGNRWWEDRDINAELKALPKEYWEGDVRDFIKEGYVPITRSEADELYKNKLDPFVSWVMLKGQETTGTEGLFMKPLTYKGYNPYYYETNTIRTDQEATELYQKYLHRYLGQTLSPAGRKDFIEKRMRDAADVWREEAELQKIAETGAGSQEERQAEQYFIRPLDYISSYIPDSLSSWFKQTSTNSIPPADISQSNNTWKTPQKTLWDSFMYSIADRQIDLRDTQKSIDTFAKSIGKLVSDTLNPSQKEQLFSSRLSKRVSDYATKEFRPVIEAMDNTGITTGQIEDYLHARHAEEANDYIRSLTDIKGFTEITNGKDKGKYTNENGHILSKSEYKELSEATIDESGRIINDADEVIGYQDGGSGMSSKDANDYLNSLNPATRQQYEKIALMVDKITHKNAQLLVDYGVESQDTIDKWFNKYKHYVPLFREDIEERPGTGRGFSVYGKASQMRKGSERKVVNILSNISMQRERYLTKGEKNRIDQALVFLEKEFPNEKFWTSYKIPDMKTYVPRGQKVETAGNVIIARILNKETGKIEHIALEFNSKDDRAMRMVKALKNMDMDTVGEVMGVLSKITRYVASINTQYNPVFGITNFFRDMGTAAFNLSTTPIAGKQKEVLQGAFPAIKGIYSALKGDRSSTEAKLFEEYQLEGGQVGYRNLWITSEDRAKEIEKELKSFQSGKPKRFLNKIARLLSDYNTTMENAVRLSAYKVGLESKDAHGHPLMTREQAAVMAKNLTVNFNKKGQIAGQAGALYAFFNASVQGVVRMFETLRGPMGKKIIAGGIILGATQAMMLAAAGFKDEEPPEFVKERNIIIPIGGKKYLTFPMPLGFNAIPNVGRILAEITLGGGKNAGIKMSNLAGIIFEAFNPMGSSGWSMQTVAPTFLDPFAALAENKDWTGKPIYKEDFNALNPTPGTSRVKDSATVFGRGLAWAFNILTGGNKYTPGLFSPTPDQIDYLGGQITGGLGREIAKTSMMFESLYTGEELPAYKLPLTGRFYGTAEGQANESSKYYSNLKKLNIHEANIKGRIKDREPIGAYIKDNPEAKLWRMANKIENNISKIKKRKELAKTPDAKKTYDKLITLQMKRLNDMVEKIEK